MVTAAERADGQTCVARKFGDTAGACLPEVSDDDDDEDSHWRSSKSETEKASAE
eukprot:CAMPEP_0178656850 /NCGR_PEP_ID=MMETSP0698-20121128/25044_1 /TAXON_ID=265572 /ORGANISM="Extubocellulus spinifer, Strain CCMP396" /LENGTH=53 /DNA_ID=CAMNT_0020298933 /DNA_START=550 /DNA_END=711 /DNA_ORIENTATION=-